MDMTMNTNSELLVSFSNGEITSSTAPAYDGSETIERILFAGKILWQILLPILITFGTIGNVLSIVVLTRPEIGTMPSKPYLIGLAVADILSLNVPLIRQWMKKTFEIDIRALHDAGCKLNLYFSYVAMFASTWILVAVTVDRLVCVMAPFQARHIKFSHRLAVIVSIVIFMSLLCSHVLVFFKLVNLGTSLYCYYDNEAYIYFFAFVWSWLDILFGFLIPFAIMVVSSAVMVQYLKHERPETSEDPQDAGKKYQSTTNLLINLNLAFLLTTSPKRINSVIAPYIGYTPGFGYAIRDFIFLFVYVIMFMNHAINFLLYIMYGPKFRAALRGLARSTSRE